MKYVHTTPLPEASQPNESDSLGQQLAELGLLDGDSAAVESISSQAADLSLEGQLNWGEDISTMLAAELDELADASLSQLPLYSRSGDYSNQGWYEIESATVEPLHANQRDVWQYSLSLTFVGKQGKSFRSVRTKQSQADNPFGNTLKAILGIPSAASKVRWIDRETGVAEPATAVATVNGEQAAIDHYDVDDGETALGIENPSLIYEVSYQDDVQVGVRAYDTRGYSAKFSNSGDGPRQWQIVHSSEHDIENPLALSNSILRLVLDEDAAPNLTAEEWDSGTSSWSSIDAVETEGAATDWELYDIDLTEIGMQDVRAQLEFEHPSEGLFDLNVSLQAGRERALFVIPDDEIGPTPVGLKDWLSPVAAEWILDPSPARGLVRRQEVRK